MSILEQLTKEQLMEVDRQWEVASRGAAGSMRINEQRVDDPQAEISIGEGDVVQNGKRKFARVKLV